MNLRKRIIICFFCLVLSFFANAAFDLACGPEPDPYDYYVSFFHNTVQKNNDYWSFYFNGYTFLNDADETASETDINVNEWAGYVGVKVKRADIKHILYGLSNKTDSIYFRNYTARTRFPDSIKNNSFIRALSKNKAAFKYLLLAKKSESFTTISYDEQWNAKKRDGKLLYNAGMEYLKDAARQKSSFLRLRYFYQAQRLLHYGGHVKEALAIYDKYIANYPSTSHVKGWALSLKGGELLGLSNDAEAACVFARVFAHYPERRIQAYDEVSAINAPLSSIIKQAKNKQEKAYIYAITGFHKPHVGLAALKNVYRVDAGSDLLGVLLVREINKIEEGYLTPKLNGSKYYGSIGYYTPKPYDSVKRSFIRYIPQLKAFCDEIAAEHRCAQPALGNLASAYLSWITGNTATGLKALDTLSDKKLNTRLYDQKQMIRLLLLSQQIKKIDSANEASLLPSLLWLGKKVRQEKFINVDTNKFFREYDLKYYSASSRDFYEKVLAPVYLRQKDTAMAALCILKAQKTVTPLRRWNNYGLGFDMPDFWQNKLHSNHLNTILRWKHSGATPYMSLLMNDINKQTETDIYDLLGTTNLREHHYNAALKALSRVSLKQLNKAMSIAYDSVPLYADPFVDQLLDYNKVYKKRPTVGSNKLSFAREMTRLQNKILTDEKNAAAYYYKMANGLYNTSYYGNAWYFTAYNKTNADKERVKGFYYDGDYLRENRAEAYFLKARHLSNNAEFKARCTFMAARCRQKRAIPPAYPEYTDDKTLDSKSSKTYDAQSDLYVKKMHTNIYFTDLQQNYSRTKFYKIAVGDCTYLRDFVNLRSKH